MAGKRVLVVDDDVKTVELVKLYLNRDGYIVLTSYDGTDALRLARESHPDLIVLDLMLPGMDGLELCRRIRALPDGDRSVVLVTRTRPRASSKGNGPSRPSRPREITGVPPLTPRHCLRTRSSSGSEMGYSNTPASGASRMVKE